MPKNEPTSRHGTGTQAWLQVTSRIRSAAWLEPLGAGASRLWEMVFMTGLSTTQVAEV